MGVLWQSEFGISLLVAIHLTIHAFTIRGLRHKAVTPTCLGDIDRAIAFSSHYALEMGLDGGPTFHTFQLDYVEAVVLWTATGIYSIGIVCPLHIVQGGGEGILIVLSTVTDAVNVPCGSTACVVEHHLVEIGLRDIVHADVGLNRVFWSLGGAPHLADEVLSIELTPIILDEVVGIAVVLMQEVLVG